MSKLTIGQTAALQVLAGRTTAHESNRTDQTTGLIHWQPPRRPHPQEPGRGGRLERHRPHRRHHRPRTEGPQPVKAVCYHGYTRCPFCWGSDGRPPRRPRLRLRCPACGRWGPHRGPCTRCTEQGHRPLHIPGTEAA